MKFHGIRDQKWRKKNICKINDHSKKLSDWWAKRSHSKRINHEYILLNTSLQYDSNTTKILFMAPSPLPPTALNLPKVHAYHVSYSKTACLKYIKTELKNNFNCITTCNNHPVNWEKNQLVWSQKKHTEVNTVVDLKYVKSKQSTFCTTMSTNKTKKKREKSVALTLWFNSISMSNVIYCYLKPAAYGSFKWLPATTCTQPVQINLVKSSLAFCTEAHNYYHYQELPLNV